jgi:hypothetical protein
MVATWTAFSRCLIADARTDRVSPRWAWRIFWTPLVSAVLITLTWAVRPLFYWLLSEDHLVEWLQFALCLLAVVSAWLAAAGLVRRRQWLAAVTLAVMALGCLGLAGEEISWGQRVFGFAAAGVASNRQGEVNLHNIKAEEGIPVEELFRIIEMLIGLAGAVLPLLSRWQPARLRHPFWRVVSPPLFLAPCFLAVFGYRFFRLLFPAEISTVVKLQEWGEVCLYGGLALMAVLVHANLRRPPTTGRPQVVDLRDRLPSAADPWPLMPGQHSPQHVLHVSELRVIVVSTVLITAITVLFAVLSMVSGIAPGNI